MHCHLAEIIKSYGPVHGFWLFSFERYNGILGNQPNNNKSIEPQIMKRFVNDQSIISINGPEQFSTDFFPLFDKLIRREVDSYAETFISKFDNEGQYNFTKSYTLDTLRDKHLEYIQTVFCRLHSNVTNIPCPNSIYKKYLCVTLHGKHFLASGRRSKPYVALAYWDSTIFGAPPTSIMNQFDINCSLCPVKIHHYALVTFRR